jgi:3-deoxy-D-manno-octulosonic-acid transferase
MIYIYSLIINLIFFLSPIIIAYRLIIKKENPKRFTEKFSFSSKKRIEGKLLWFHAASIGEFLSIIPLIKKCEKKKYISQILITSSTLTSANLFKKYKFKKTLHQFYPIDLKIIVSRFLKHWKPDLVIFIDSEIWPNMLLNLKKKNIPTLLFNARISSKSFKKWMFIKSFFIKILNSFEFIYPQNLESKNFLKKLKLKNIKQIGNLKFTQDKKKITNIIIDKRFNNKKIWCAASTHDGEEKICLEIHKKLLKKYKNLILVIIPRHVERIEEIKREIKNLNLKYQIHNQKKIINNFQIYIVNSYGETEYFYKISDIVFMGKSITKDGGQNPLEPARNMCKIIHGSKVSNFRDIYKFLNNKKIAYKANSRNKIYELIDKLIAQKKQKNNNNNLNKEGKRILVKYVNEINSFLKINDQ